MSSEHPRPDRTGLPLPFCIGSPGMVPSCLFDRICQKDAHGRCEHVDQLFPRAGVDRL
jgi:hypothetical protein